MAWEMGRNMHSYLAPSIQRECVDNGLWGAWDRDKLERLFIDVLETIKDHDKEHEPWINYSRYIDDVEGLKPSDLSNECIVQFLADTSAEYGTTVNGSGRFYLADKWTEIEWCSDDDMNEYWASQ